MSADEKYTVIVSDKAKRMLGEHFKFIADVSQEAAAAKVQELVSAMRSLAAMPQRFPFLDSKYIPKNKYHKMFVPKWYLILYQIKDNIVFVDYVLDCRKDYDHLLR